ncbi:MAG: MFS transporter [Chloroflexi bacterium]|nr:MFS transporter [Chloroflexota bacterium]
MLWIGQFGQAGAMWMEIISRNWLIWDMTHQAIMLAALNATRSVPSLFFGLVAGVAADRFNKKRVLQAAQVLTFASYAAVALLLATDSLKLWHLFLTTVVNGVGMAFNQPARQSIVPRLVPKEKILNAVALSQIAMNSSRVIGPAVSGLLIVSVGMTGSYVAASLAYLLVIVTTAFLPSMRAEGRAEGMWDSLKEGLGYIARTPHVRAVLIMVVGFMLFGLPYMSLMPIVADRVFHMGAGGYGVLFSLAGIGALVGGFLTASLGGVRNIGLLLLATGGAFSLLLIALGNVPWVTVAFPIMVGIGAGQSMFMALGNGFLLTSTPQRVQGRVMSVNAMDRGLQPAGSALGALIADVYSAGLALAVMGSLCGAVVVALAFGQRKVLRAEAAESAVLVEAGSAHRRVVL